MATRHLKTRSEWEDSLRVEDDRRPLTDDIDGLDVGDVVEYPGARARVRRVRFYPGFGDLLAF